MNEEERGWLIDFCFSKCVCYNCRCLCVRRATTVRIAATFMGPKRRPFSVRSATTVQEKTSYGN